MHEGTLQDAVNLLDVEAGGGGDVAGLAAITSWTPISPSRWFQASSRA